MKIGMELAIPRGGAGKVIVGLTSLGLVAAITEPAPVERLFTVEAAGITSYEEETFSSREAGRLVLDTCVVERAGLSPLSEACKQESAEELIDARPDVIIPEREQQAPETTTTTLPPPLTTTTTTTAVPPPPPHEPSPPAGGSVDWMNRAGIAGSEQGYVDYIMGAESGWNPSAVSSNGCIGLGQNCRDQNGNYWLDDACPNWENDPVCQLRRFAQYAIERYGGWRRAYEAKKAKGWW